MKRPFVFEASRAPGVIVLLESDAYAWAVVQAMNALDARAREYGDALPQDWGLNLLATGGEEDDAELF